MLLYINKEVLPYLPTRAMDRLTLGLTEYNGGRLPIDRKPIDLSVPISFLFVFTLALETDIASAQPDPWNPSVLDKSKSIEGKKRLLRSPKQGLEEGSQRVWVTGRNLAPDDICVNQLNIEGQELT